MVAILLIEKLTTGVQKAESFCEMTGMEILASGSIPKQAVRLASPAQGLIKHEGIRLHYA